MADLRKSREKKLMGVAGGIAEYTHMDPTVWRALWVLGAIMVPPLIIAYIIMGIVMPDAPYEPVVPPVPPYQPQQPVAPPMAPAPEPTPAESTAATDAPGAGQYQQPPFTQQPPYTREAYRPLTKSRDRWVAGVCGGIADYFGIDPVLVRALWLVSIFFFGTGLFLYLVLAVLMPSPVYRPQ